MQYMISYEPTPNQVNIQIFTDGISEDAKEKIEFYVEFERHGFDKGSIFYFLRKNL